MNKDICTCFCGALWDIHNGDKKIVLCFLSGYFLDSLGRLGLFLESGVRNLRDFCCTL